jgi:hypothetical protein
MKKLSILLLSVILFIGCSSTINTNKKFYSIVKIEQISDNTKLCIYYISTNLVYTISK